MKLTVRFKVHRARPVAPLPAVSLGLAVLLLLLAAPTALAISGYGSPGPAVRAQYPDSNASTGLPSQPAVSNLGDVIRATRAVDRDPKVAVRLRKTEAQITQRAQRAVLSSSGITASQSGSIAVLLAAIAVLSIGGVLRWRRA